MSIKVAWPNTIALIYTRPKTVPPDWKGAVEHEDCAYELGFSKEEIVKGSVALSEKDDSRMVTALETMFKCSVVGAYYLPLVFARPLEGKLLPKGILSVRADGETVMKGEISEFLPDLDPVDCLKSRSWEKTKSIFRACTMRSDGSAEGYNQIGVMLTNYTKAQIELSDLKVEEKMSLEVGFLAAYYSTKKSEITV